MATFIFWNAGYEPGDFLFSSFSSPTGFGSYPNTTVNIVDLGDAGAWDIIQVFGDLISDTDGIVSEGLVTAMNLFTADERVIAASGLNVDAAAFHTFWLARDTEGFLSYAMHGHDDLHGGNLGGDILNGYAGNDIIFGNGGDDRLTGGQGNDVLDGGEGDDVLVGASGNDGLIGGNGVDTADFATAKGNLQVDLSKGTASGTGIGSDTLSSIENVRGSAFSDRVWGDASANVLDGQAGDDFLYGQAGDDKLWGRDGADYLDGGAGYDLLTGGAGSDTFAFSTLNERDQIMDFQAGAGGDVIRFRDGAFASLADVLAATTQKGGGCFIVMGGARLTLTGVNMANLTEDNFEFASSAPDLGSKAGLGEPLVLPAGMETKFVTDEAPIICPPGDDALPSARPGLDLAELGLSDFGGRDPHRFLMEPRWVDWMA